MAKRWVEGELVTIGSTSGPAELEVLITARVDHIERDGPGFANYTVANEKLFFFAHGEVFEDDGLGVTFANEQHFVLFVDVVLRLEREEELVLIHRFRSKLDVEMMMLLAHNGVVH